MVDPEGERVERPRNGGVRRDEAGAIRAGISLSVWRARTDEEARRRRSRAALDWLAAARRSKDTDFAA